MAKFIALKIHNELKIFFQMEKRLMAAAILP